MSGWLSEDNGQLHGIRPVRCTRSYRDEKMKVVSCVSVVKGQVKYLCICVPVYLCARTTIHHSAGGYRSVIFQSWYTLWNSFFTSRHEIRNVLKLDFSLFFFLFFFVGFKTLHNTSKAKTSVVFPVLFAISFAFNFLISRYDLLFEKKKLFELRVA